MAQAVSFAASEANGLNAFYVTPRASSTTLVSASLSSQTPSKINRAASMLQPRLYMYRAATQTPRLRCMRLARTIWLTFFIAVLLHTGEVAFDMVGVHLIGLVLVLSN